MKILILTMGTLGDVQPFVALGKGLKGQGHDVTLCTHETFRGFITDNDLSYAFMNDDVLNFIGTDAVRDIIDNRQGTVGWIKTLAELAGQAKPMIRQMMDEEWTAAQEVQPEAIIYNPRAYGGYHIVEKMGVPGFMSVPFPAFVPTGDFPLLALPNWKLGRGYNRLSYAMVPLGAASYAGMVNDWRQEALGLQPRPLLDRQLEGPEGSPVLGMHCYSRHVLPSPEDWPETITTTGYWFLDRPGDWQPAGELKSFLEAGPPPVYVGFGSMAGRRAAEYTDIVVEALKSSGQRGVLAMGWGGLAETDLPDDILAVESVPHDWLFPQMAAVVHHGGAGTTAAGFRAGKPTVIVPFIGDQPFWANRVIELGVGPKPIPKKKFNADRLAYAIRIAVTHEGINQRAASLGQNIQSEDGIGNAINFINKHST